MKTMTLQVWEHILTQTIEQSIKPLVVAIDGDAASGKTTFSACYKDSPFVWVIPMDHFYLPFDQRTDDIGGHMDYDKLIHAILIPHRQHKEMHYGWYDPHASQIKKNFILPYKPIIILEGAYSCHPKLRSWIDLSSMFTITPELQKKRIIFRSDTNTYDKYNDVWIPKEKHYQTQTKLDQYVDYHIYITE